MSRRQAWVLDDLFEPHTQLYRRGRAEQPNQFGRQVLVYEDAAGFISHYHLMDRDSRDADVIVEQTRITQEHHHGEIEDASFDRGFFSEDTVDRGSGGDQFRGSAETGGGLAV
ncbi:MAG: hypothetical protein ABGZ35_18035 [Planctomycetaceae bacterium]